MTATFHVGDALEVMGKLPENSVDLVLTSPPFLALRSYLPADHPDKALEGGSQATPGAFIDWLIDVVEACDRVLAPHGSMCIELGDTYSGTNEAGWHRAPEMAKPQRAAASAAGWLDGSRRDAPGWPLAKSLSLIPELFRLTLVYGTNPLTGRQTDRWRLRNVVRWVRPNPPVGALGDKFRPATSELMVFCKSAKRYFDLDATREPADPANRRPSLLKRESIPGRTDQVMNPLGPDGQRIISNPAGAPPLDWWNIPPGGFSGAHYAVWPPELLIKPIKAMCPERVCQQCGEPSRRITERDGSLNPDRPQAARAMQLAEDAGLTQEHFAAIRSFGISDAGKAMVTQTGAGKNSDRVKTLAAEAKKVLGGYFREFLLEVPATTGFSDCGHDDWRPGLVLDPFGGSGTTALVATGHGRDCVLIDLDERNFDLALQRVGPFILSRADSV